MRAHDWTQTPKDWCTGLSYWRDSRIFWTGNVAIQDVKRTKGQSRKELEDIHLPLSDGVIRIIHWLRASQSTTDSRRLPSPSTGILHIFLIWGTIQKFWPVMGLMAHCLRQRPCPCISSALGVAEAIEMNKTIAPRS